MTTDRSGYRFVRGPNKGLRRNSQRSTGSSVEHQEESLCKTKTPCIAEASVNAISPAISLPLSPASSREQPIIETQGNKWSNQSGNESESTKPNCYACKHRRDLLGDAHSKCVHPRISQEDAILSPLLGILGMPSPAQKRLNVSAHQHGIKNGWFAWPINFDPCWLITCDGFEK